MNDKNQPKGEKSKNKDNIQPQQDQKKDPNLSTAKRKHSGLESNRQGEKQEQTNQKNPKSPAKTNTGTLFSYNQMMIFGFIIRMGYVFLNETYNIHTDIDYHVYTEGARELSRGKSPYARYTYRYTPLLAYMMLPNLHLPFFGKILFNLFDLVSVHYVNLYLRRIKSVSQPTRFKALLFCLLNPFMIYINGRGSCESISVMLLAGAIYHMRLSDEDKHRYSNLVIASLFYGLLVHFRLYPAIFGLTIYMYINRGRILPRLGILIFGIGTVAVNALLSLYFYREFGEIFLEECYLYHLKRKDPRHNYSLFWISTVYDYFSMDGNGGLLNMMENGRLILGIRLVLIVVVAASYRKNHLMAMLIQTFVFTTLNTVYTAQYVVWEVQLLPYLLIDNYCLDGRKKYGFWLMIGVWFVNLEVWAYFSGKFEHGGENSLYTMHLVNIGYFLIRVLFVSYFVEGKKNRVRF